ncbi:hypothetical protein L207DRAFT_512432 [Hyaloscypha variabilis F]|uniref:Uncharacterized protein n=1 Tax=Hyaloscypha variabilis (strain UAMH 11265 / GT02V1 / F) TaxID=1149755 RepID=A0A2J6RRA2_HYAVF|nr:hypothetical protein L207DRAFT_512432 [Hyaloscypha variabilis F]
MPYSSAAACPTCGTKACSQCSQGGHDSSNSGSVPGNLIRNCGKPSHAVVTGAGACYICANGPGDFFGQTG